MVVAEPLRFRAGPEGARVSVSATPVGRQLRAELAAG